MGCSTSSNEKQADGVSTNIDERLKEEYKKSRIEVKLLLLGPGESGKSTIAKQMRIIHGDGYSHRECKEYKQIVHSNTFECFLSVIRAMENLEIKFDDLSRCNDIRIFFEIVGNSNDVEITEELGTLMTRIWKDKGVQLCFSRSREYQLCDSAGYFLNKISTVSDPQYVPTQQDILKTQVRTTGIVQTQFSYKSLRFKIYDVGGQRSERKKWLHCFEDVSAVIFCVALSEYDLVLREDSRVNRMVESMKLYNSVCNNQWFRNTSMILFLNKKDLFKEKILKTPLNVCFEDYIGNNTYEEAAAYIEGTYANLSENGRREVYTHLTCATDTIHIQLVFDDVVDVIIGKNLNSFGIM